MTSSDDVIAAIDSDYRDAINSAAKCFRGYFGQLRSASRAELKPLLDYLASERPLGIGERRELVLLLSGELGRLSGRAPRKREETQRRVAMHNRYRAVMTELRQSRAPSPRQENAIAVVAREFHCSAEWVRQIIRDPKMRKFS
jgi:hypothetical protein